MSSLTVNAGLLPATQSPELQMHQGREKKLKIVSAIIGIPTTAVGVSCPMIFVQENPWFYSGIAVGVIGFLTSAALSYQAWKSNREVHRLQMEEQSQRIANEEL